jgi:hypothetical protein
MAGTNARFTPREILFIQTKLRTHSENLSDEQTLKLFNVAITWHNDVSREQRARVEKGIADNPHLTTLIHTGLIRFTALQAHTKEELVARVTELLDACNQQKEGGGDADEVLLSVMGELIDRAVLLKGYSDYGTRWERFCKKHPYTSDGGWWYLGKVTVSASVVLLMRQCAVGAMHEPGITNPDVEQQRIVLDLLTATLIGNVNAYVRPKGHFSASSELIDTMITLGLVHAAMQAESEGNNAAHGLLERRMRTLMRHGTDSEKWLTMNFSLYLMRILLEVVLKLVRALPFSQCAIIIIAPIVSECVCVCVCVYLCPCAVRIHESAQAGGACARPRCGAHQGAVGLHAGPGGRHWRRGGGRHWERRDAQDNQGSAARLRAVCVNSPRDERRDPREPYGKPRQMGGRCRPGQKRM